MIELEDLVLFVSVAFGFTQVVWPLFRGHPLFPIFRPRAYRGSLSQTDERLRLAQVHAEEAKKELEAARLEAEAAQLKTQAHHEMERTLAAQMESFLPPPQLDTHTGVAEAPQKKERKDVS